MTNEHDSDAPLEAEPARAAGTPAADNGDKLVHTPSVIEVPTQTKAAAKAAEADAEAEAADHAPKTDANAETRDWHGAFREVMTGNVLVSVLAFVAAMVVGGILIALTDPRVQSAAGYFFARPTDTLQAVWVSVSGAFGALFQGAVLDLGRAGQGFGPMIKPLTDTIFYSTPLIAAGLGVAIAFRAGLFNIGGRGQMLAAATAAGWVGAFMQLPPVVHVLAAVIAGIIGGALWGGIAGFLKARTGAHEVISTIMLNFVALYAVQYMLRTPGLLQNPDASYPIAPPTAATAVFPALFGSGFKAHWGFVLAVLAVVFCWWLVERSNFGFQLRAVGLNPNAALNAGMNVKRITTYVMLLAGGFMGLAGAIQVQGTLTTGFGDSIDAGIGFDAITVALLGRSTPWGTFVAAILFGAFQAGGYRMRSEGVSFDIVLVVQSLIVLFIAAPPLVRTMFGLGRFNKKGAAA